MERFFGAFERVLFLPASVEAAKAWAVFKNGVLKVTVPKAPGTRPAAKEIPIQKD